MKDAHQLIGGTGRISQRAEKVENRAYAELFAHRGDVFHRAVVSGGKHKADAGFRNARGDLFGRQGQVGAECFEYIRAARRGGRTASAVFGNRNTRGGGHKHRGRGDVKGVAAITARATHVDHVLRIVDMHGGGEFAHHFRSGSDFTNGFFFDAQAHEQGRGDGGRHLTTHQHTHEVEHFIVKDFAMFNTAVQCFAWSNHGGAVLVGQGERCHWQFEKVTQHRVTMFTQNGFGVKLYAIDGQCFVAHAHNFTIRGLGGDFQTVRNRSALDGQ